MKNTKNIRYNINKKIENDRNRIGYIKINDTEHVILLLFIYIYFKFYI